MDPCERKRQYSAMRRAIAKSCEPALLAKFQLCNDGERCHSHFFIQFPPYVLTNVLEQNQYGIAIIDSIMVPIIQYCFCSRTLVRAYMTLQFPFQLHRWSMLKQWMLSDGSCDSITVEEKYSQWVEQLRSDKYVTVLGLQSDFTP